METIQDYLDRFDTHSDANELMLDYDQLRETAIAQWAYKWEEALVRVVKLDGTQFFID